MIQTAILSIILVLFCGCDRGSKAPAREVNLAIWSGLIPPQVFSDFEKEKGIKVHVTHYSSNEELLAKLQTGVRLYDLALPADYMVLVLRKLNLLEELDHSLISNLKELDPSFLHHRYDPENKYSVPFERGTTGIAINRSLYSGKINSWKDVFTRQDLAGKFSLLDDMREVIGIALKSLGYSLNSKNPEELKQAKAVLAGIKNRIKAFNSETIPLLLDRDVVLAQAFVSDTLQAKERSKTRSKDKIEYVFPAEGGAVWMDNFVIPKGAQHPKEAHELISFLLAPKAAAITVSNFFVAPSNLQTLPLLSPEIRNNSSIFPSPEILKRYEMVQDLEEALPVWERIWTELKV